MGNGSPGRAQRIATPNMSTRNHMNTGTPLLPIQQTPMPSHMPQQPPNNGYPLINQAGPQIQNSAANHMGVRNYINNAGNAHYYTNNPQIDNAHHPISNSQSENAPYHVEGDHIDTTSFDGFIDNTIPPEGQHTDWYTMIENFANQPTNSATTNFFVGGHAPPEDFKPQVMMALLNNQNGMLRHSHEMLKHLVQAQSQGLKERDRALEEKVATLEKENAVLQQSKKTLTAEYNVLRGFWDFRLGHNGKLYPVLPDTNERVVLDPNIPRGPKQDEYMAEMKRLIQLRGTQTQFLQKQVGQRVLKADIGFLPLTQSARNALSQGPQAATLQPVTVDLTGDETPSNEPAQHAITAQGLSIQQQAMQNIAGKRGIRYNPAGQAPSRCTVAPSVATAQEAAQINDTPDAVSQTLTQADGVPAVQAAHEVNNTPATNTAQQTTTENAQVATTPSSSIPAKRPAPPDTPPASADDYPAAPGPSAPKRRMKEKKAHTWLTPSENQALRKASGDLPNPFKEFLKTQAVAAASGGAANGNAPTSNSTSTSSLFSGPSASQTSTPTQASSVGPPSISAPTQVKNAPTAKKSNSPATVATLSKAANATKSKMTTRNNAATPAASSPIASKPAEPKPTASKPKKTDPAALKGNKKETAEARIPYQPGGTENETSSLTYPTELDDESEEEKAPHSEGLTIIDHNDPDNVVFDKLDGSPPQKQAVAKGKEKEEEELSALFGEWWEWGEGEDAAAKEDGLDDLFEGEVAETFIPQPSDGEESEEE